MKSNTKTARAEIKSLILRKGLTNIINADLNEIRERTGISVTDIQNAISYFSYSPQTAQYR